MTLDHDFDRTADHLRLVRRVQWLLAVLVIVVAGPVIHEYTAQPASRYLFTAAVWDHQTIRLDAYVDRDPPILGVDRSVRDGHTYSDKAPLQPLLAVPFYAMYRAVGGEAADSVLDGNKAGVWWQTLWLSTIPGAALAMMMYRLGRRVDASWALPAAASLFFGTILLPFSGMLFAHVLAAALLFGAFVILARGSPTSAALAAAGGLAGAAVAAEYTSAIALIVLLAVAVLRHRWRSTWFVLGGVPFALLLGVYHSIAFGSPFAHPYRYSAFNGVPDKATGMLEIFGSFRIDNLADVFLSWRGFLVASVVVVLALVGCALAMRSPTQPARVLAIVGMTMFGGYLLIPAFWANPWGGASPGPRYMVPALAFVIGGMVVIWRVAPWATSIGAAVSVTTMLLAAYTDPLIPFFENAGVRYWYERLISGDTVPTIFTVALGPPGWIVHALIAGTVATMLVRAHLAERRAVGPTPG